MAIEALFPFTRIQLLRSRRQTQEIRPASRLMTLECSGRVYDEVTFEYLLRLEQQRAVMWDRPYFLLLVGPRPPMVRKGHEMSRSMASSVFGALEECVRNVDSVGWYRQNRIAGAVLPQGPESAASEGASIISARITEALRQRLSPDHAKRLRVRVVHLGHRPQS